MSAVAGNTGRSKTPMSSVSGITLLTHIVWYRGKAMIRRLRSSAPAETSTIHKPPIPLPHEIIEMIITHLIFDRRALKACSLTCYSWYLVAVPHLHHTITFGGYKYGAAHSRLEPLSKLHELGIIPLVAEIQVWEGVDPWFTPRGFSPRDLRYFSAFTNVQKLTLLSTSISSFIPEVERYFGQFSATLRSITLYKPYCTPRQLSYFLSLFSNLDNVEIRGIVLPYYFAIPDTELVPISALKLRGRLVLDSFHEVETWKDLITSHNGLRFRAMDLRNVGGCAAVLLGACSETLETLRLFPVEANWRAPRSLLPDFDLSQLEVLRSLRVNIQAIPFRPNNNLRNVLVEVFSTITSPLFSEVIIILEESDISRLPLQMQFFEILRVMNRVRTFNLVFLLEVPDFFLGEARQKLTGALDLVAARGLLDFLKSPPTIRDRS